MLNVGEIIVFFPFFNSKLEFHHPISKITSVSPPQKTEKIQTFRPKKTHGNESGVGSLEIQSFQRHGDGTTSIGVDAHSATLAGPGVGGLKGDDDAAKVMRQTGFSEQHELGGGFIFFTIFISIWGRFPI